MNAKERLLKAGFEDVIYYDNPSYDDALIGVTGMDNRAVYDYEKMIEWLVRTEDMEWDDAVDFIESDTIVSYFGNDTPIIMFSV